MRWGQAGVVVLSVGLFACSRKSESAHEATPVEAPTAAPSAPSAPSASSRSPAAGPVAIFSRPIAAAHLGDGSTLTAGLVVASSSIMAVRVAADGSEGAASAVLSGATWSSGVELKVLAARDGAVVAWRGVRAGKSVTQAVRVGSNAVARDAPFAIGSAACTTDDGQAWLDQGAHGATRLRVWPWEATAPTDVLTIPADRDPELVCAAARVFALAGGEEDVTATRALGGDAGAPVPILRTKDFPREDEREHDAYTVGDTLGLVRMGDSGTLALREWAPGGLGPWRTLQTKIAPDDDIVAVDADAESVVIVFTHEVGEGCGEGAATAVRALRVRRGSTDAGPSEAQLELGAPQCDRDPGPFWTGVVGGAVMVGWAERGHAPARRAEPAARTSDGGASEAGDSAGSGREASPAPIAGFSYAAVSDAAVDGAGSVPDGGKGPLAKHVDLTADEIVSAGCDKDRCYAAALIRPPGQDGMEPEAIRVLSYR